MLQMVQAIEDVILADPEDTILSPEQQQALMPLLEELYEVINTTVGPVIDRILAAIDRELTVAYERATLEIKIAQLRAMDEAMDTIREAFGEEVLAKLIARREALKKAQKGTGRRKGRKPKS